jgi:hypothetical protein
VAPARRRWALPGPPRAAGRCGRRQGRARESAGHRAQFPSSRSAVTAHGQRGYDVASESGRRETLLRRARNRGMRPRDQERPRSDRPRHRATRDLVLDLERRGQALAANPDT